MRKFLVRNFVLDYRMKLFGKYYNAPRASRIIFPLFVITGLLNSYNPNFPFPTPLIWVCYFLVVLSVYFGFIHFNIASNRANFDELDEFQKFQYGSAPFTKLNPRQMKEWLKIRNKYEQEGNN